jgi:hypothetical protein
MKIIFSNPSGQWITERRQLALKSTPIYHEKLLILADVAKTSDESIP